MEIEEIASKLIVKYYNLFSHIDLSRVKIEFFGEDIDHRKPVLEIIGVGDKIINLLNEEGFEIRYVLRVNEERIVGFSPIKLQWMLFKILLSIDSNCDGKLCKYDFTDFCIIVDFITNQGLGSDYLNDKNLPDLLDETTPVYF